MPGKDNSRRKEHQDAYFAFAQVNYVQEMCAQHADESCIMSCNDMNKVNVWSLVVSQYHQISCFFPVADTSQYQDQDIPFRNSKVIPSGYMMLTRKSLPSSSRRSKSLSPSRSKPMAQKRAKSYPPRQSMDEVRFDKLHRMHHISPKTGPLFVFNRAAKFHSSISSTHASDLTTIIDQTWGAQKPVVSLLVDGGPCQNPAHLANLPSLKGPTAGLPDCCDSCSWSTCLQPSGACMVKTISMSHPSDSPY